MIRQPILVFFQLKKWTNTYLLNISFISRWAKTNNLSKYSIGLSPSSRPTQAQRLYCLRKKFRIPVIKSWSKKSRPKLRKLNLIKWKLKRNNRHQRNKRQPRRYNRLRKNKRQLRRNNRHQRNKQQPRRNNRLQKSKRQLRRNNRHQKNKGQRKRKRKELNRQRRSKAISRSCQKGQMKTSWFLVTWI